MKKYPLPYFGDIDLSEDEDFYEIDTVIEKSDVNLTVDFEGEKPAVEALDRVKHFLSDLPLYLDKISLLLRDELDKSSGFVSDYISTFKESIEENGDVDDYIDNSDSAKSIEEQLFNRFYLLRVGVYPSGGTFAVLDYTIDDEYTDDLLVVYLTDKGELDGITIES